MKPYYQDKWVTIYLGDCREILPLILSKSIDLITTDPPYESMRRWEGIGTTARMGMGRKGGGADDESKFFKTIPNEDLRLLIHECSRLLKVNTHCYIMCDAVTLPYFYGIMNLGLQCPDSCIYKDDLKPPFDNLKPLIWDKETMGMGYHWRCQYEFILMFDKGKRKLQDLGKPDILKFKRYVGEVPTQKPLRLFEMLISQSSDKGELVLDPFVGSGTTCLAAKMLGRKSIGIEIEEKYCEIAAKRCSQGVFDLRC